MLVEFEDGQEGFLSHEQLTAKRLAQLRLLGNLLVVLGGFLISTVDTIQGLETQAVGSGRPSNSDWFGN